MEIAVGAGADAGCEEIGLGSCRNDENAGARIILTEPADQFRLAGRLGTEEQDHDVDDGGSIKHALPGCLQVGSAADYLRSEEHTSELQSLMRISYAVFCLKKKKTIKKPTNINTVSHTY